MTLTELLKSLYACEDAVVWRGNRDLKTAWAECERGDWMLWLCGKMVGKQGWPTHQDVVIAACDCAELALPIFEKKYPKDQGPRVAIETARKWALGEAAIGQVRAAAAAYAYAANAVYAANAAYAAVSTVTAASIFAYAAEAAAYAAAAAAAYAADAKEQMQIKCADICRAKLKVPKMKA